MVMVPVRAEPVLALTLYNIQPLAVPVVCQSILIQSALLAAVQTLPVAAATRISPFLPIARADTEDGYIFIISSFIVVVVVVIGKDVVVLVVGLIVVVVVSLDTPNK